MKYYEHDDEILPPLNLDPCLTASGDQVFLAEPLVWKIKFSHEVLKATSNAWPLLDLHRKNHLELLKLSCINNVCLVKVYVDCPYQQMEKSNRAKNVGQFDSKLFQIPRDICCVYYNKVYSEVWRILSKMNEWMKVQ